MNTLTNFIFLFSVAFIPVTFKVFVARYSCFMWGSTVSLMKLVPAPVSKMVLTLYGEFCMYLDLGFRVAITNPLKWKSPCSCDGTVLLNKACVDNSWLSIVMLLWMPKKLSQVPTNAVVSCQFEFRVWVTVFVTGCLLLGLVILVTQLPGCCPPSQVML